MNTASFEFILIIALIFLLFVAISSLVFFLQKYVRLKAFYEFEVNENQKNSQLYLFEKQSHQQLKKELESCHQDIEEKKRLIDILKEKSYETELIHEKKLAVFKEEIAQLTNEKLAIQKEWQVFQQHSLEKIRFLESSEARLAQQFENLSQRMITHSQESLSQFNHQHLTSILSPLKAQIDQFNQQINERFTDETKERLALKYEITQLHSLNQRLAQEALNLTNALKSNNKIQGNWGEMILMNLLEAVGFSEGREYSVQRQFENEARERFIPDVIVHLPDNKHVIIDAKVSLIAFENYYHATEKAQSDAAIKALINSIKMHMKGLSEKHYASLKGLNSLDYVLMFIPIESAFILAMSEADNLLTEAQKQHIMLVSPSTLLVALRTIQQLWRTEYKNQNADEIALRASKLYDKFRLFLEDFQAIGLSIQKTEQNYHNALNKLSSGKGNLIHQVEGFRGLGVDVKKTIDKELVDLSAQSE